MSSPRALTELIRDRLDARLLPTDAPLKIYAGYGRGAPCDGCGEAILPAQVEYEMDHGREGTVRFHLGCAGLWEAECRRRGHRSG